MEVTPYHSEKPKKAQVEEMFDSISAEYDKLNSILSLGIHKSWRKRMLRLVSAEHPAILLDVATGTADVALEAAKQTQASIVGIDLSEKMLEIGKKKVADQHLQDRITLQKGDAEALPFEDETFDAITVAFGVRNFGDLDKGLREMRRVLKTGKKVYILEFSRIGNPAARVLFNFYFKRLTPFIAGFFTKDTRAYTYLPESVKAFPHGTAMLDILTQAGYLKVKALPFALGTATLYTGHK